MPRILHVVGARPNFMKIAPILSALKEYPDAEPRLVHTGQHYDEALSRIFFQDLGLPKPDDDLGVGSGSHAQQTARIMMAFEPICTDWQPHRVVVVGDVNSTVATALVASKLGIPVAHVEAGLRSFDTSMPEEVNRMVTDRLSDLLFTTEESANENLKAEGVPSDRIHFVGNVMIDTLLAHVEQARELATPRRLGLERGEYVLVTLHRPSNVDDVRSLESIADGLSRLARSVPVIFPVHPRTHQRLKDANLDLSLKAVRLLPPQGYLEFLGLMDGAGVVITDSGGVQEETTALGIPCRTVRENTERPITITHGTNRLIQTHGDAIHRAALEALEERGRNRAPPPRPALWDGQAGTRIAKILMAG
ncbi:MAG: UDP-N-acetylglucosamine 2-epimerase (non-hydrolyzing) [Gemmatimonadota bacterium]